MEKTSNIPSENLEEITLESDIHASKTTEIFAAILNDIVLIDFRIKSDLRSNEKLKPQDYIVCCIIELKEIFSKSLYEIGSKNNKIYLFDGSYWKSIEKGVIKEFLGTAAEKMGVHKTTSQYFLFNECLMSQLINSSNIADPPENKAVIINLENGSLDISLSSQKFRPAKASDFLRYQLPFCYDPAAKAHKFQAFLDQMLPDKSKQMIIAEFFGYVFIKTSVLKLEKTLLLLGDGANGKSVIFEILSAMLGSANVCNFTLSELTDHNGGYRAQIADKLLNYATEISGKIGSEIFKQLVSGEPVGAKTLYHDPIIIKNYAKLAFNCNSLPDTNEHNYAFFRRFIIINFVVTIAEENQDKQLAKKIIESELAGVFNWVLEGLGRLNENKAFSVSESIAEQVIQYRDNTDTVYQFLKEESFAKSSSSLMPYKILYSSYREYCISTGSPSIQMLEFKKQLLKKGFEIERKTKGNMVYIEKVNI